MPREIDEDLIEATIRRVAESAAASQTPSADDTPPPDILRGSEPAEDEDGATDQEPAEDADGALKRLRFDDHDSFGRAGGPRRFSAEMPGGVARSPWSPVAPSDDDDPDADGGEEPAAGIEEPAATHVEPATAEAEPLTAAASDDEFEDGAPVLDEPIAPIAPPIAARPAWRAPELSRSEAPSRPAAAAALPSTGDETSITAAIGQINARLDMVVTLLERLVDGAQATGWQHSDGRLAPLTPRSREPISRGAVAEQLQADRIDTRPLPQPLPPLHVEPKRGLELLPRTYRITVEDKRQGVDLVPLHRALLAMDGVKDMSLLSYNNGVAIVALETNKDIDPDVLGASVSRAMSREAAVEVHNEHTMVVKLAED